MAIKLDLLRDIENGQITGSVRVADFLENRFELTAGDVDRLFSAIHKGNNKIDQLNFTGCYMGELDVTDAICANLKAAAADKTPIAGVIFDSCNLGDDSIKSIADYLATNPGTSGISLNHNSFTKKGIGYLAEALAKNTQLTTFFIENHTLKINGVFGGLTKEAKALGVALVANPNMISVMLRFPQRNDDRRTDTKIVADVSPQRTQVTKLIQILANTDTIDFTKSESFKERDDVIERRFAIEKMMKEVLKDKPESLERAQNNLGLILKDCTEVLHPRTRRRIEQSRQQTTSNSQRETPTEPRTPVRYTELVKGMNLAAYDFTPNR